MAASWVPVTACTNVMANTPQASANVLRRSSWLPASPVTKTAPRAASLFAPACWAAGETRRDEQSDSWNTGAAKVANASMVKELQARRLHNHIRLTV